MEETNIWQRMQAIDRRIIYAILIGVILVPLFIKKFQLPIIPSQQSKDFYNTINQVAATSPDKLIIVDGQWGAGTRGENQWQTQAIITHLMQKHLHFAILSFDPQNNTITQNQIVEPLAEKYHYVYGQDYINWGYKPSSAFPQMVKGIVTDIPGTIKTDWKAQPVTSFPVMKNVKTIYDVGAIVEITPAGTLDTWIGLAQGVNKTPVLYAPTAVMAPDCYSYLDSGQVSGLLTGVKGAGDYETLIGVKGFGTRATGALSMVYALIILLIILGNIGYFKTRRTQGDGR